MKNIRKIGSVLLIAIMLGSNVFAADLKTALNVVEQASEIKYLENNQGYISKTIVDSNPSTGEVTVELKLANTKKEEEVQEKTEVMLVIDNSPSMDFVTSNGQTRKEIVISATKQLVSEIFENSTNVKIGIVYFHGVSGWNGAGISNATLGLKLADDKNTILSTLDKLNAKKTEAGTNIDAGLQRAEQNFSSSCKNKIIVLLTDGVPNADVKGNDADNDTTTEEALIVQNTTKETLQRLDKEGYHIISMMTGMSAEDGHTDKNGTDFGEHNIEEDLKAVERIFGTSTAPTAGKYYLVQSANVNNVVTNDILTNVMEIVQNPINTVKIVDYFPEDITDNFEFSYVGEPSIGTVSEEINTETNTITWDIDTLKGNEVATLQYKLKIKDMQNSELLNKTIATNEKVVLTYTDIDSEDYTVTLNSSPKIQLSEVKEEIKEPSNEKPSTGDPNDGKDPTTANGQIPQTGVSMVAGISIVITLIVLVFLYKKNKNYKDIK